MTSTPARRYALLCALLCGCNSGETDRPPAAQPAAEPAPRQARATPIDAGEPAYRTFPDLASAARQILAESQPRILGVGEFHVRAGAEPVLSTMQRFTADLDTLSAGATDLIVETWVQDGTCGRQEQVVSREIEQTLERPPAVENHLLTMMTGAKKRGIVPHVMTMTCADYDQLTGDKGQIDYNQMLLLVKNKLADLARKVVEYRGRPNERKNAEKKNAKQPGEKGVIIIYGGALHNDEYPFSALEDISYVSEVRALVGDGYVELDLYVPEYIEGNALAMQETWYPPFLRHASEERVLVFQRGPRSYLVILRRNRR